MSKVPNIRYQFYATLLDSFQSYLSSDEIWEKYWGSSTKPETLTPDEFCEKSKQDVLDRINRVPFQSAAADQGTCFNEIVDCLILNKATCREDMVLRSDKERQIFSADFRGQTYEFPMSICWEFAKYYKGALPQVFCEGVLPTKYGDVRLYGYIDELMPFGIHDIKTTGGYQAGNFRKHWQHHAYPFCMEQMGTLVKYFEYNICEIKRLQCGAVKTASFTEFYPYLPEETRMLLTAHCEQFIEFIEANRHKITDTKIFNQE